MRWSADDQGKALAWTVEQRGKCLICGTHEWEFGTVEHPVDAYVADGFLCPGCELLDSEKERRADQETQPGMKLVLYSKGPANGT